MFLKEPPRDAGVERIYRKDLDGDGYVMNLTRLWAWRPDVYEAFVALRSMLTKDSTLSPRELAVIVCATVSSLGDSYCSLAWGAKLAKAADAAIAAGVIDEATPERMSAREAALADWARRVVRDPNGTTAKDVEALRAAGLAEREIFEATAFVAMRLAFSTVNDALGAQPDAQLAQAAPAEVRAAVSFGRPVAEPAK